MDPMIVVTPEPGNLKAIAKRLIEAAGDNPGAVQFVSYPRNGFIVPEEIYERFKAQEDSDSEDEESKTETPKRRGRPRKADKEE